MNPLLLKTAKQIGPVYHGTPHVFDEFAPTTGQRTMLGLIPISVQSNAFFFTPDITTARNWAANRAEKGDSQYVLECTITLNNPIDLRTDDWTWDEVEVQPLPFEDMPNQHRTRTLLEALREYTDGKLNQADWRDMGIDISGLEVVDQSQMYKLMDSKGVMDALRFLKYDGAILDEGDSPEFGGVSYAVFNKSQIKIVKRTKIAAKPPLVMPDKNIRYAPLEYEDIGSKNMVRDEYLPPLEYEDIGKNAPKKASSVREISISEDYGSAEGYTADTSAEQLQNWLDRFGYTNDEFVADLRKKYDHFAVLNNINVYEDSRGKGYGDYLLREFLREAEERGAGVCLLVADTAEEQAKGFNLVEWYERNDFEQIASVYGGELMIYGIQNPKVAAAKTAADIGTIKNIISEMMGVLAAGLPHPEVKIVNQTNRMLGYDVWQRGISADGKTWGGDNTTIGIQKSIVDHEESLRRIIAHELCHHEVALLIAKPKLMEMGFESYNRYKKFLAPEGHGKEWQAVAARFNAKYGADFVTEFSDQSIVSDAPTKEYFVLLNNYVYGRGKQRLGWQWALSLSSQAMEYLDSLDWASGEFKLVKTNDHIFTKGRGRIKKWGGWNLPRTPEQEQKLQDLWANAPMAKFGTEDKTAKSGPHKNATTQINLPPDAAAGMMEAAKQIPDAELGTDGREDDPHITIKYGVKPDPALLSQVVGEQQPFTVTLGKTHVFEVSASSDNQAPIVVQCHAPELAELHNKVMEAMGTRPDDFPYVPHVTLAYVKPDVAAKYEGMDWAEGISFQVDNITLSTKGGGQVRVPFSKPRKSASHKTPPLSDTQYENPEMGEETNAYADIPERVKGVEDLPALEDLSPALFKTGAQNFKPMPFDNWCDANPMYQPDDFNEAEYRYDENVAHFSTVKFPITIYRAVQVEKGTMPNLEKAGIYWTWVENSADAYFGSGSIWDQGGPHPKNPETVIIKAKVLRSTDVDWDATLLANMLNEEENEITIKSGADLQLVGVMHGDAYKKPVYKRLPQKTVTAFGDDSKNLPMRGQKGIGGQDFPLLEEQPLFSDEKEAAGMPKFYHGTPAENLDDILKNGLKAGLDESSIEWGRSVYLACDAYTAKNYEGHHGKGRGNWVVLEIDGNKLHEDLLRPDDYDFRDIFEGLPEEEKTKCEGNWAWCDWRISLEHSCQVAYMGDIPPDAIKVIQTPKFGSKTADIHSYYEGMEQAADSILRELEQHVNDDKYRQKWQVVPAARLKKIWNDYAKTSMVRDEKGMDDIAWTVLYNIFKIHANTILCGHTDQSPNDFAESITGENFEEKYGVDKFGYSIWDRDNAFFEDDNGQWRLSDFALDKLINAAGKLEQAQTAEQKLQAVDRVLNIVHARSDLASWFVQGGTATLNSLAGYKKASGSTQLLPDEVEMVADVAHGSGGKSFPKLEKEPLFPEDKEEEKTAKVAKQYGPVYHGTYREWSDKIQIDQYKIGKFFSSDPLVAQAYGTFVHECYLTMNKPFIVDAKGSGYSSIPTPKKLKGWVAEGMDEVDTDIIAKYAYENGYDGAIIKNVYELHHQSLADDYIVFKPTQIKRKGIIEPEIDPYTANKYHKQELLRRQKRDWEAKYPEEATTASVKTAAGFMPFNAWLKKSGGISKLLSEYDVDTAETYGYGLEEPENPADVKRYEKELLKRATRDFQERYEELIASYESWQFPMDVFRCISLPKAEEAQQGHLFPGTPQARFQQGLQAIKYQGVGIYWSWDENAAECHWGSGGPSVTLHGVIQKNNVDWEGTIYANMFPTLGQEEKEVRLLEGTQFELEEIQYDEKSGWSQPPVQTVTASVMGQVYLLHFDIKPGEEVAPTREDASKPFHARHYMGWAENAQERIDQHYKATSGVKLIEAIHAKGISFTVARIWDDVDRDFERRLKNQGGLNRHCPICKKLGLIPASRYRGKALEKQVAPASPEAGPDFVEIEKNAAAADLANLRSYLTLNKREMGEELARTFSSYWQEFVENEHPEFAELIDEDGYTDNFDTVPENVFGDFLDEYSSRAMQDDPAMAPTFLTVDYRRDVKNAWLVHFTDYPEAIAKDGFKYGMDRVEQLALTTYFKDEAKKFGGYNFALDAHHRNLEGLGKNYGKHCVLFQANGIETYHSGDDFEQIIFWGKDAKNIIPIMHWNDEMWHVGEDADGNSLFSDYNLSEVVEWAIANAATLKPKKVRKQRATASETMTLYHRTRPGREEQINAQGLSHVEGGGELWFTDDPSVYYGDSPNAVYSIEVPKAEAEAAHVGGHDYRFMGRSFGPEQIKKVAAEPWEMRQDEYAGRWNEQETEEQSQVRHQKNQDWEQNALAALSLGKITPEVAKERGVYEAKSFKPLPSTPLYHVTTAKSQVQANGLKTRRELGQDYGKGLGGGTSMSISFTDDYKIAEGIYENLLIARKVAAGEMTLDDMIDTATRGVGANRPWINDILKSLGGSNKNDTINVELDALKRGVAFEHGLGRPPDDEKILPQYRKPGPWRPTPWSQHWKGGDGEEKYTYWERDLTAKEKQERVFEFFKKWSFWREQAGGGLDPLYFMSDPAGLAQVPESEIAILTFKAVPGAVGTRESALGEWRVYTGAAVQLVNAAAAKMGMFNPNRANVQYKSEKGTGEWEGWHIDFSADPVKEHMLPASFVRKLKGIEQKFTPIADVVETQGEQWTKSERVDEIHTQMEAEKWFEAILVDEYEDQPGKYYLEEGHHRTRAASRMGKKTIPAVIMRLEPRKPHWSLSSGIVKKTADIAKFAFFIEVPKEARGHFWEEPPAHNLEFWAFRDRPPVLINEKVYFTFDKMPVAETTVLKVEKPGESICELTGKYEKHWKLYWEPAKFVKYAGHTAPTLYHGTCPENAQAILKNGWQPNQVSSGGNAGQPQYLYLTNFPENAQWFANEKGCNTILEVHNVPMSSLAVDPEDGTEDTVENELNFSEKAFPGTVVLTKSLDKSHFKVHGGKIASFITHESLLAEHNDILYKPSRQRTNEPAVAESVCEWQNKALTAEDKITISENPDGRIVAKHPQGVAMGTMEDRAGLANWFDWNALPKGDTGKYDKGFVLGHISVRVDARRTGLGRALVGALLDAAKAQGAEVCFLTAFSLVGLSAKELDAFYTNVGFQSYFKDVYVRKLAHHSLVDEINAFYRAMASLEK